MNTMFLLTPFGTGLAGYPRGVIRGLIETVGMPRNVFLYWSWLVDQPMEHHK